MIRVRVLPDAHTPHLLQAYAGLTELARQGNIALSYFRERPRDARTFHRGSLWAVVDSGAGTGETKVCLDLFDGGDIATPDGLKRCDLYFKRSYDPRALQALPDMLRRRVHPLGLNCFLLGDADRDVVRRVRIEGHLRREAGAPLSRRDWSFRAQLIASAVLPRHVPGFLRRHLVPRACAFEAAPGRRRADTIVLQCRVWPPDAVTRGDGIDELNDARAALVRALRQTFGARFLGGLVDSTFARSRYPDCITPLPSNQADYIGLIQGSLVGIVTTGIHGSIPWKTAEYLASSCCIVTEVMRHELPQPLVDGVNTRSFDTPEQCIAHCDWLLSHPADAADMQAANAAYYRRSVRPDALADRWVRMAAARAQRGESSGIDENS